MGSGSRANATGPLPGSSAGQGSGSGMANKGTDFAFPLAADGYIHWDQRTPISTAGHAPVAMPDFQQTSWNGSRGHMFDTPDLKCPFKGGELLKPPKGKWFPWKSKQLRYIVPAFMQLSTHLKNSLKCLWSWNISQNKSGRTKGLAIKL